MRTELRHDLVVDLRGALVDDQQGDVILAHFTRDGAESCLRRHLAVEQFVSFFHRDDQWARLPLALAAELIGALLPALADAPGEQVGHQQVVQVALVFAEGEDDVVALVQQRDDLTDWVAGGFFVDVGQLEDPPELRVQPLGGHYIDPGRVCPGGYTAGIRNPLTVFRLDHRSVEHLFECVKPVLAEVVPERVERGRGGFLEVELAGEHLDVGRGDVLSPSTG